MARILFISYGVFENLGIESISASLKANGHTVSLLIDSAIFADTFFPHHSIGRFFSEKQMLVRQAKLFAPDMICFSVGTDNYIWAVQWAGAIKEQLRVLCVFGGVHPTLVPERVIAEPCVDIVCVGDGEGPLVELAASIDRGKLDQGILSLWFKQEGGVIRNPLRPVEKDLSKLSFADKEIYYRINPHYQKEYVLITSRGCHYNCAYCSNHALRKVYGRDYVRKRPVWHVIDELKQAKSKYAMRYVWFVDDLFFTDLDWLKDFSAKYGQEIGVRFFCYLHPDQVNEEVLALLSKAGCHEIGIGAQSCSRESRKVVRRPESWASVMRAGRLIKAQGIRLVLENIIGLPHEDEETLLALAKDYNELRPALVLMNWLRLYPGVDMLAASAGEVSAAEIERCVFQGEDTQLGWKSHVRDVSLMRQMAVFLEMLPFLPKNLVSFIIYRRIYRRFPGWFRGVQLLLRMAAFIQIGMGGFSRNYDSGARGYLRNVVYFAKRNIFERWGPASNESRTVNGG